MNKIDFSKTLVRCHMIGDIMSEGVGGELTETQSKNIEEFVRKSALAPLTQKQQDEYNKLIKKRDYPELGVTCKKACFRIYAMERYDRRRQLTNKYIKKGLTAEDDSIFLLSRFKGKPLVKNAVRFNNEYLTGEPDIIEEVNGKIRKVSDVKSSYDLDTFLVNMGKDLNKGYDYQATGYMAITGAIEAEIDYCLTDMPENMLKEQLYFLLRKMDVASDENEDYKKAAAEMRRLLTYDDIPLEERVLEMPVARDDDKIIKIYNRVVRVRNFLEEIQDRHLSFNKTTVAVI